jgi:hypothetical protein
MFSVCISNVDKITVFEIVLSDPDFIEYNLPPVDDNRII